MNELPVNVYACSVTHEINQSVRQVLFKWSRTSGARLSRNLSAVSLPLGYKHVNLMGK